MTRRLGKGDPQRGRARVTLLIVTLTSVGLLLGLSPGGPLSTVLAAVNGTPTATTTETTTPPPTTTPTAPSGATIELINPSGYVTPVIVSNKADEDTSYHLVAWVGNPSSVVNPIVEFRITPSAGGAATTTLTATRVGDSDTWHAFWTVANEANGNYNVTAELFGGDPTSGTPVDGDTQAVTVNKSKETAELTYPTIAGFLGTFDPVGPATRGFVVDATLSADATGAEVFYGTAPPGTEQNWRHCSIQETVFFSAPGNVRVGCTTAAGVDENDITGVAVAATGTDPFTPVPPNCDPSDVIDNPPQCPTVDSGDAHRVTSYSQNPTAVTVTPASSEAQPNNCQVLTATVTDQVSRPIWRANLDVHARGPVDNLQFGRVTGRTRDWQPADSPGSGHDSTEPTHNCGGMGTPPAQAEHNRPGQDDEKHIETKPADQSQGGADTSGAFPFALRSPNPGTTDVEAWVDTFDNATGDNDARDSGEPSGTATITWSGATPTQSASATRSPSSSPTSSPTTSPSATRSPTTSPSATRSPTTSPSATRSPTTTTSPTRTATTGPSSRTITMEASRNVLVFGQQVIFSGAIDSADPGCESGEVVNIQQQTSGAAGFTEIGTAVTDSAGAYAFRFRPAENANYRAVADPSAECNEAISDTSLVLVRVRVSLRPSDRRVPKGSKVTFTVTVAPCGNHADTDAVLERSRRRGFTEIGRKGLNESCKAKFEKRVNKTARYKGRWPSQDDNHESGVSRTKRVRAVSPKRRNF